MIRWGIPVDALKFVSPLKITECFRLRAGVLIQIAAAIVFMIGG